MRRVIDHVIETTPAREWRPDPWSCLFVGLVVLGVLVVELWP